MRFTAASCKTRGLLYLEARSITAASFFNSLVPALAKHRFVPTARDRSNISPTTFRFSSAKTA